MNRSSALGSLIGFVGWALALMVLLLSTTSISRALAVSAPCVFTSLGLWANLLLVVGATNLRFGARGAERMLALVGGIVFSVGVLLQLYVSLVLPELEQNRSALSVLDAMGSTTFVPTCTPLPLLAVGLTLLCALTIRWNRTPTRTGDAQNQAPMR